MNKYFITAILTLLLLTFSACREITVTTTVHKDGSFTRVITLEGDSSSVMDMDLPYPIDETWEAEMLSKKDVANLKLIHPEWKIVQDTSMEEDYLLTYRKTFDNSMSLNDEINRDTGWRKALQREVTISRQFGFFYSYLTFREVYKAANPFDKLDIHDYLSKEEIHILSSGMLAQNAPDSSLYDEVEERAFDFLKVAIANEIIDVVSHGIKQSGIQSLQQFNPDNYRDSIDHILESVDFQKMSDFIDLLAEWSDEEALLELHNIEPDLFKKLDEDWNFLEQVLEMEDYLQQVSLAGLVTSTNSTEIVGNQLSWNVDGFSILLTDFEMVAESRVVNYWAFGLSAIVLLLLILLLFYKSFKK